MSLHKSIFCGLVLIILTGNIVAQDYYEGFEDGNKNGYSTVNGGYEISSTSKVGSYSVQSNTDGGNKIRSGQKLGVTGVWKTLIRSEGGSYADLDLYAGWRPTQNEGYRIQYYPAGTDNPKFNIVKVGNGTLATSSPDFGINTWIELTLEINPNGTITATAESNGESQTIRATDSSLYTQDGYIGARHYDSPGYVDYFSYSAINDDLSICDRRGPVNECISNSTHEISGQNFSIASIFQSEPQSVFKSLDDVASVQVTNSTFLSGFWEGSFKINSSQYRTTIRSGAKFKPKNGLIVID